MTRTRRWPLLLVPTAGLLVGLLALLSPLGGAARAETEGEPRVYVANSGDNSVSVIDVADRTVVDEVPVGSKPLIPAAAGDGRAVYVGNSGDGTVSVVDPAARTVRETFDVGGAPIGLSLSPDGSRLYVVDNAAGELAVLDPSTGTVERRIPVGNKPISLAVSTPAGDAPAAQPATLAETGGPRVGGYLPGPGLGAALAGLALLGAGLAARRLLGSS